MKEEIKEWRERNKGNKREQNEKTNERSRSENNENRENKNNKKKKTKYKNTKLNGKRGSTVCPLRRADLGVVTLAESFGGFWRGQGGLGRKKKIRVFEANSCWRHQPQPVTSLITAPGRRGSRPLPCGGHGAVWSTFTRRRNVLTCLGQRCAVLVCPKEASLHVGSVHNFPNKLWVEKASQFKRR